MFLKKLAAACAAAALVAAGAAPAASAVAGDKVAPENKPTITRLVGKDLGGAQANR